MEWFQAVVLGVLQGLTEFLPISSSGHLRIYPELFGWEDPGAAFTAVTQIGTETAVILYFAKDIGRIIRAWSFSVFRRGTAVEPAMAGAVAGNQGSDTGAAGADGGPRHRRGRAGNGAGGAGVYDPADARMGWYVILGTIPIVVCGITFKDVIEHDFRSLWIVGTTLVVLGVILGISDRVGRK
ncbi:undecaprenyl-diphosphate phosphatase, partial [Phytoactinopolyspora endophytica]|uniref:undecaprenyl-diphosphate phosphatase n=1 Tax=Phytoactinopolyspora endophytica TaxID=1642495 RepID=UPI0023EA6CE7